MTIRAVKLGVLCVSLLSVTALACQKKIDPAAFEAGAAPSTVAAVDSSAAVDEAGAAAAGSAEPLAPLETGKPATAAHVAATGGAVAKPTAGSNATTRPAVDPPECANARNICNNVSLPVRKGCKDATFACFNKGGHL
ncbi:MAG: hypothetical protein ABI461_06395 [Polyangiaceae bacterium]